MHTPNESDDERSLESLWAGLLSQDAHRVRRLWARLDLPERGAILAHLREMATGEGWQPPQREGARVALEALAPGGVDDTPSS